MRKRTVEKLFNGDQTSYRAIADCDGPNGSGLTFVTTNRVTAIIQELKDEADGFQVYIAVASNSVDDCKKELGIPVS